MKGVIIINLPVLVTSQLHVDACTEEIQAFPPYCHTSECKNQARLFQQAAHKMLIYLFSINKNIRITTLFKTLVRRQNISLEPDSIFKTNKEYGSNTWCNCLHLAILMY